MYGWHIVDAIHNKGLLHQNCLHVVTVISNPARYHSRYRIARDFIAAMEKTPNVQLHLVESAYGDRNYEVVSDSKLEVRTRSEIWTKENMINLGVRHLLPKDWKYMAWIDADVFFSDPNWSQETMQQLQHYAVLQPWSDCLDLGPLGNVFQHFKSFGFQHQRRIPKQKHPSQPYQYAHTGFAWACRRDFWENVGGLMDWGILGSNDHHMAFAMIGEVQDTIHGRMGQAFFDRCMAWQQKAMQITRGEVGFSIGRIEHKFHGPKKRRYYRERWQILIDHGFDPNKDLIYDAQGLLQLVGKPALEHAIHLYNLSRHEDSTEET